MTDEELLDMDAKQEVERMAKKLDKMVTKKNTVGVHLLLGAGSGGGRPSGRGARDCVCV